MRDNTNFKLVTLTGKVVKQDDSFFLKRTVQEIDVSHKILDSTSRSPLQSKRFISFIDKDVIAEGYFVSKVFYIRRIKGQ